MPVPCPQVALRIRPLNSTELEEGATVIAHKVGDQVRLEVMRGILSPNRGSRYPGSVLGQS